MIFLRFFGVVFALIFTLKPLCAQTGSGEAALNAELADFYTACPWARTGLEPGQRKNSYWATNTADIVASGTSTATATATRAAVAVPGVPRIAVWGDSHTAAGDFVYAAMQRWGFARDGIRPGMIAPALLVAGVVLPLKKFCTSAGWKSVYAPRTNLSKTLLQLSSDTAGDWVWLDFRAPGDGVRLKSLNVHYAQNYRDRPLIVAVSVDNGPEQTINLSGHLSGSGNGNGMAFFQVRPKTPLANIRMRLVAGQISIQGFEPVYSESPKAVLDIFSVPGSTASVWSGIDPAAMGRQNYNTVLFQYGTNEATDPDYTEADYTRSLRQSLAAFRTLNPQARCIVLGPPDRGNTAAGSGRAGKPWASIHQNINTVQARVAGEVGCLAWNWQMELGGPGAAARLLAANPPLMQKDQIHLTQPGYALSGQLFAQKIYWK